MTASDRYWQFRDLGQSSTVQKEAFTCQQGHESKKTMCLAEPSHFPVPIFARLLHIGECLQGILKGRYPEDPTSILSPDLSSTLPPYVR